MAVDEPVEPGDAAPTEDESTTEGSTAHTLGGVRWPALVLGALLLAAVGWAAVSAFGGYIGSHPIGWITLVVSFAIGLTIVAWAIIAERRPNIGRARRWAVRIGVCLVVGLLLVTVIYTRPHVADQVAIDALTDGNGVDVDDAWTRITMRPHVALSTGVAFYPGALVDPRAYARLLRPVAEAGYPVVIFKQPFNLAILDSGAASSVIGADDAVDRWVVGGHSLGGAMASRYAETDRDELVGLLLYAAFPVTDMSARDLLVASISGTNDGLADLDDIADSVADLPASTDFVAVEGAIHAHFGDYGTQRGDGQPEISRTDAQRQIVAATLEFLARVDGAS